MAQEQFTLSHYAHYAQALEEQIAKVIVGQHNVVRTVMVALLSEGHILLEGVPGLGKTKLLTALSEAMGLSFGRIQFTPDLMPADVTGTQILEGDAATGRSFRFREGPIFNSLVLADEINRATPKTQSALLEAMAERTVTVAGETKPLPRPFLVMATQNPIEQEGTYPLPEAQLDRFMFKALVPFPTHSELHQIITQTTVAKQVDVQQVIDATILNLMISMTHSVPAAPAVIDYAVDLVIATHPTNETAPKSIQTYVRSGASPRGAQALVLGAKVLALLDGRPAASTDDVRLLATLALGHRLTLGYEATADGKTASDLIEELSSEVTPQKSGIRGAP